MVAIMQTAWITTGKEHWLRLTKFFGKLFLINFSLGVVTGIVQEFQFGMNWSEYSRMVGDIFGAPLAMEALAAFFIESTFIGLWIFGWKRLNKKVHLVCIWLVAFATNLSAVFILAANSWMQNPVGSVYNPENNRAELTDIFAVLTSGTFGLTFFHTIMAAWIVAGTFVAGICGYLMVRSARAKKETEARNVYRPGAVFGLIVLVLGGIGIIVSGDMQAKHLFEQQPMKMAAAEALCEETPDGLTDGGAPFSLFAWGSSCDDMQHWLQVPGVTSFLSEWDFNAPQPTVPGTQKAMEALYGEGTDYSPSLMVSFWSFRLMMLFGVFSAALALIGLWVTRKGRITDSKWFSRLCLVALPMPFIASSFGWIFTEMGRQPWIVVPSPAGSADIRMLTADGVSGVSATAVLISLIVFTLIYGILAVAWFILMKKYAKAGAPEIIESEETDNDDNADGDKPLSFAY